MADFDRLFAAYGPLVTALLVMAVLALLVMHIRLQASVGRMRHHYQRLVRSGGASLEEVLDKHLDQMDQTAEKVEQLDHLCRGIEQQLQRAVQRVGLVRFNPFSDTGGDQSFSIALLDGENDGLVISSLFSRSETRVFAKPVQNGQSKYNLTAEEDEAIQLAGGARPAAAPSRTR